MAIQKPSKIFVAIIELSKLFKAIHEPSRLYNKILGYMARFFYYESYKGLVVK